MAKKSAPAAPVFEYLIYLLEDSGSVWEGFRLAMFPGIVYSAEEAPNGKVILRATCGEDEEPAQDPQIVVPAFVGRLLEERIIARCDASGKLAPEDVRYTPVIPPIADAVATAAEDAGAVAIAQPPALPETIPSPEAAQQEG